MFFVHNTRMPGMYTPLGYHNETTHAAAPNGFRITGAVLFIGTSALYTAYARFGVGGARITRAGIPCFKRTPDCCEADERCAPEQARMPKIV